MPLLPPIPGETPIDDLSGLKIKGIFTRTELNQHEAANILKVLEKYFVGRLSKRIAPFDYSWALALHREMFGDVWTWAGVLRQHDTNIGVKVNQVEIQLFDLMERLKFWGDQPWITQAAWLHHQAVQIHPFPNGNGRWSRMLANIWLRLHSQPFTQWPEDTIGTESIIRQQYLEAIKTADTGKYAALVRLHQQHTPQT
jgi:Fic-DOC domain mobile mystery protein B